MLDAFVFVSCFLCSRGRSGFKEFSKGVPLFFLAPSKLEDPHSFARKASTAIDSISAAVTCYDLYSIDPTQETKCAFS